MASTKEHGDIKMILIPIKGRTGYKGHKGCKAGE
jgi:hypothetical protein